MIVSKDRRACLLYVAATANVREAARVKLEQEGYTVCEVRAELEVARAAEAGDVDLPAEVTDCMTGADLCVFLIPEYEVGDGLLVGCGGLAVELGKRFIVVAAGARETFPQVVDDGASAIVRDCDEGLIGAIRGDRVFVKPDGSRSPDRPIDHVRCQ
jgi:hypothetical protein